MSYEDVKTALYQCTYGDSECCCGCPYYGMRMCKKELMSDAYFYLDKKAAAVCEPICENEEIRKLRRTVKSQQSTINSLLGLE